MRILTISTACTLVFVTATKVSGQSAVTPSIGDSDPGPTATAALSHPSDCEDCHLPRDATDEPLDYAMYTSPTIDMRIESEPDLESSICLTCHARSEAHETSSDDRLDLGTNLRNDHPISIAYDPTRDPRFRAASPGPSEEMEIDGLPLFDGRIQCSTCHMSHGTSTGLLRAPTRAVDLCVACHLR